MKKSLGERAHGGVLLGDVLGSVEIATLFFALLVGTWLLGGDRWALGFATFLWGVYWARSRMLYRMVKRLAYLHIELRPREWTLQQLVGKDASSAHTTEMRYVMRELVEEELAVEVSSKSYRGTRKWAEWEELS